MSTTSTPTIFHTEQTPLLAVSSASTSTTSAATSNSPSVIKPPLRRWNNVICTVLVGVMVVLLGYTTVKHFNSNRSMQRGWQHPNDGAMYDDDDNVHINYENDAIAHKEVVSVAFVGNSMFYFNDFPRFFQAMASDATSTMNEGERDATSSKQTKRHQRLHSRKSQSHTQARHQRQRRTIVQNSVLHGGASISSMLLEGNAMYPQFRTPNAQFTATVQNLQTHVDELEVLYDYGACTVPQLLVGRDDRLFDPGYAIPNPDEPQLPLGAGIQTNPCRQDAAYLQYSLQAFAPPPSVSTSKTDATVQPPRKHWDFVLINDNTKNPSQFNTRSRALANLERFYVPWLLESSATPVFLWTHAYTPATSGPCVANATKSTMNNNVGLDDIANFTSLTRVGYQAYVDLLALYLPPLQYPRIAPVGLAFLVVHDENFTLWQSLFHCDGIHASPSGTWLQGMVVYYTLFGQMPDRRWLFDTDRNSDSDDSDKNDLSLWWNTARMMQHAWEPPNRMIDVDTADYLYRVAERVMVQQYVPPSFIPYHNGEFAEPRDNGNSGTNHDAYIVRPIH